MEQFDGTVRFAIENYGDSDLAKRFGVKRYPAIFAGDVLVATPKDFGFYGAAEGAGGGRYAPLNSARSHERFRSDLARVITLLLAGRGAQARKLVPKSDTGPLSALPALSLTDVEGRPIAPDTLAGRAVLVEFWATWCPPCRRTLGWLAEVKKRYGDRVAVLTIAIESDQEDVRKVAQATGAGMLWTMGSAETARAFGDVSAVPTLHLFDAKGRGVASFFGAPPTLHEDVERELGSLVGAAAF